MNGYEIYKTRAKEALQPCLPLSRDMWYICRTFHCRSQTHARSFPVRKMTSPAKNKVINEFPMDELHYSPISHLWKLILNKGVTPVLLRAFHVCTLVIPRSRRDRRCRGWQWLPIYSSGPRPEGRVSARSRWQANCPHCGNCKPCKSGGTANIKIGTFFFSYGMKTLFFFLYTSSLPRTILKKCKPI